MANTDPKSANATKQQGSVIVAVLLELPFDVHRKLKSKAALKGEPLRKYLVDILTQEIK